MICRCSRRPLWRIVADQTTWYGMRNRYTWQLKVNDTRCVRRSIHFPKKKREKVRYRCLAYSKTVFVPLSLCYASIRGNCERGRVTINYGSRSRSDFRTVFLPSCQSGENKYWFSFQHLVVLSLHGYLLRVDTTVFYTFLSLNDSVSTGLLPHCSGMIEQRIRHT